VVSSARVEHGPSARLLFAGGTIWAGAAGDPQPGWLLAEGGLVRQVGSAADRPPEADVTLDLAGRHVLPGFVDTHTHLTLAALTPAGTDGTLWRGPGDAIAAVRQAALADARTPWLLCWNASPGAWPQARLPTAAELDAAAPGRKALVCAADLHRGAVSLAALDDLGNAGALRHSRHAADISRDSRGRPTGELWEAAFGSALRHATAAFSAHLGDTGIAGLLQAEAGRHLAAGITHAHDPYVPPSLHGRMTELRSAAAIRLSWATGPESGLLSRPADPAAAPAGLYGDAGPEVKLFLDGADRCGLCLPARALPGLVAGTIAHAWRLRAPGQLRAGMRRKIMLRGGRLQTPYLRFGDAELTDLLGSYAAAGFRLRLHALGNLAAAQAARALCAAGIVAGLATIDHLTVLDPQTAGLVGASGAHAGCQPGFLPRFGPQFAALGIDRHLSVVGGRMLTRAGAPLVLSSDHPCGPLDPLGGLRAAVGRRLADGTILQPAEALTPAEAVRAATTAAAASIGAAGAGGLAPGEPADLVICTGDPLSPGARVAQTWVAGVRAWPGGEQPGRQPP
jgi:predicted amidohydrolase YtcJ